MNELKPRIADRPLIWPDIVQELRAALGDAPAPIFLVGGAVRDAYLHRPIKDIDLATPRESIKLAKRIADHFRGDIFVLDDERGVARVLVDRPDGRLTMDVARYRGEDLLADLRDRDFTVNAMAVDVRGDLNALIDPLNGERDAASKLIRRCSPTSIADDPIRALRAVRLSAQLGMRIEAGTLEAVRASGVRLLEASPERIRDELVNAFNLPKPASALRAAERLGLLQPIIPEINSGENPDENREDRWRQALAAMEYLADILTAISPARTDNTAASFQLGMMVMQLDRYRSRLQSHLDTTWSNARPHRALLMLALLLYHCSGGNAPGIGLRAEALRFSKSEKQRLLAIVDNLTLPAVVDRRAVYRFWRQRDQAGVDVCLLVLANDLAATRSAFDQDRWLVVVDTVGALLEAYYEHHDEQVAPPPLLDGSQLIQALDLPAGPLIGKLLEMIREEQAVGTIQSPEDAIRFARAYLEEGR